MKMKRIPYILIAVVLVFGARYTAAQFDAADRVADTAPVYQLHGSGTSNPAQLVWKVMDIMMARTKPKIAMSYRAIGSGAGATEFAAGANAFSCGDVPLPTTTYTDLVARNSTPLHVPYLVGTVSFFHNVPGVGKNMRLSPCVLGRILRGNITNWGDRAISELNPDLADLLEPLSSATIRVVHRNPGSSSTYGITHYMARSCPQEWNQVPAPGGGVANVSTSADPQGSRTVGVTTEWPADGDGSKWKTVTNSQGMVTEVAAVPYSIGYVESGQGIAAGLEEVQIIPFVNTTADGTTNWLSSEVADVADQEFISATFPLSDLASANWTAVNPVMAPTTNPRQWPITLGTYFYVFQDLTFLRGSGGLLAQFLDYMLSDDVANLMPEFAFVQLPRTVRQGLQAQLTSRLQYDRNVTWRQEASTNTTFGQDNFVFSKQRDSYLMQSVNALVSNDKDTRATLALGDAYQVHGSGSFVSAVMLRHAMSMLTNRARVPVTMTYRAVGSSHAQREYSDYRNMYKSYNHFKVSDYPLSTADRAALINDNTTKAAIGDVLQVPFAVGSLGVYYNKALPGSSLALTCENLARMYSGDLTSWADEGLAAVNNYTTTARATLLNYTIVVYGMASTIDGMGSGPTTALTSWFAASCPAQWAQGAVAAPQWNARVTTTFAQTTTGAGGGLILTPQDMLEALSSTPNSIGYLPTSVGAASGLAEARLVVGGTPYLSRDLPPTAAITQARTDDPTLFSSATSDMARPPALLYGRPNAWPMPMVQYLLMYRNLTGYGLSGPLLRYFARYLVSNSSDALATDAGLWPMPQTVNDLMRADIDKTVLKTLTVSWSSEDDGMYDDSGSGLYTFSANRESYESYALAALQSDVANIKTAISTTVPLAVRMACTLDIFPYTRLLQSDLEDMSSLPLRVLGEMLPASGTEDLLRATAAAVAPGGAAADTAPTHMVLHPGPLPTNALANTLSLAQIPAVIRPVAIVYRGDSGLRLSPCTLGRILKGEATRWNDNAIMSDNPGMSLPNNPIAIELVSQTDADALAVLQYVQYTCPTANLVQLPSPQSTSYSGTVPELVLRIARPGRYSGLGLVAAAALVSEAADGWGLAAAALMSSVTGTFVTPTQTPSTLDNSTCPSTGCAGVVADAFRGAVDQQLAAVEPLSSLGVPTDLTGDWRGFTLMKDPKPKNDVYPLVRFDFILVPTDLSGFGATGAAVAAAVSYATGSALADRINSALGPYFVGIGAVARARLVQPAVAMLHTSPDAPAWGIANSSVALDDTTPGGGVTLLLSRAPSTSPVALPGSDVATSPSSLLVTRAEVEAIARQAVMTYGADPDKLDTAYNIAVAAIVIGVLLSLAALALAAWALSVAKNAGGGGVRGPAALSYKPGVDATPMAQPMLEMQPSGHV